MISLLLLTHNRDIYLKLLLDSLIKQTNQNFELNIAETANMFSTYELLKNYSNNLKINCWQLPLKLVDKTKSLNFLAKQCNYDIISVCDTDVLKPIDFIDSILQNVTKENFCLQPVKYLQEHQLDAFMQNPTIEYATELCSHIKSHEPSQSQVSLYRENFFKIGGYNEKYFGWGREDNDLIWRLEKIKLKKIQFNNFGIHVWHEKSNVFQYNIENTFLFDENKKLSPYVTNHENVRLDNQYDVNTTFKKII